MGSKIPYADNKVEGFQAVVADENAALQQYVDFTGTSEYSANLEVGTTILELFSTQDCWVRLVRSTSSDVAAPPGAEATKVVSLFIPGGITAFLGVQVIEDVIWKLAVIRDASNGTLYIKEGA